MQNTQQLTLKVEGVIQHGSTPGLFRKIHSVCLNASTTLQSKPTPDFKVGVKFPNHDQKLVTAYSVLLCRRITESNLSVEERDTVEGLFIIHQDKIVALSKEEIYSHSLIQRVKQNVFTKRCHPNPVVLSL